MGKLTLMSQLQNSVVERVNVFVLPLTDFREFEPCCPKITNWFAKFFKPLQYIVDIIGLVWWEVKVVVYIFAIWT